MLGFEYFRRVLGYSRPLQTYNWSRLIPILVLKPGIADRRKLCNFLKEQLKLIEKGEISAESNALASLLRQSIEGLRALKYGESQPMFAPGPKLGSKDGSKPYTLRKLKMKALGFADLLIANKYEGEEAAIRKVASAYGQKADAFRGWRKRLGKTDDKLMNSFRKKISKLAWDKDHVLGELQKAGAKYLAEKKLAFKSKK